VSTSYHWLLLGHFIGIAVLLGANGLDLYVKLGLLRATTTGEMRALLRAGTPVSRFTAPSTVLLFGCGVGLVLDSGSFFTFGMAWVVTGIVIVVAMCLIEPLITARRVKLLEAGLDGAPDGPADAALIALARDRVLHTANRFGIVSTLELFYVMTLRPAAGGTLVSLAVMLVVTAAWSAPVWSQRPAPLARQESQV
jgi:hypothetical protein